MGLEEYFAKHGGKDFPLPEIAGRYRGRKLVICADAACLWDDLEAFGCRSNVKRGSVRPPEEGWDFMTVNKAGECFPGDIEHWYSNEPHTLDAFVRARRHEYRREFEGPGHTHSCNKGPAKWKWPWKGRGTSGLGACLTGIALGYEGIVLCGMPLDNGPHNGEPHWRGTNFVSEAGDRADGTPNGAWTRAMEAFDGKVKSMSGRTREWLGEP